MIMAVDYNIDSHFLLNKSKQKAQSCCLGNRTKL